MSPGTRVYWYEHKAKLSGVLLEPPSKESGIVVRDNGKVVEVPLKKLYVFMRELPL